MYFQRVKSKFNLINKILIFSSLIIISSANKNPKRFLQFNTNLDTLATDFNDTTNETIEENNETTISEDPGTYLLAWFFIFFFIGLYIICTMKRYPEISDRTDDVYKFMFLANNGILVTSDVNIFSY